MNIYIIISILLNSNNMVKILHFILFRVIERFHFIVQDSYKKKIR